METLRQALAHHAARRPGAEALRLGERALSYRELQAQTDRRTDELAALPPQAI